MSNDTVFQSDPDSLRTLIFGRDATATARAVATDTIGNLQNIVVGGTIDSILGATITAGTLTSAGTITNILGGTITNVLGATITAGTLDSVTSISQKSFYELATNGLITANTFISLPPILSGVLGIFSFFIYNSGPNPVNTQLEISADGIHYYVDTVGSPIAGGESGVLVPGYFMKYTRLSYQSQTPNSPTTINVILNAQGT